MGKKDRRAIERVREKADMLKMEFNDDISRRLRCLM